MRARSRGRFAEQSARRIWLLFLLWNIAFTLWGDETELALNQVFGGMPLALFVKSGCMMLTFYLYYLLLKPMRPERNLYRVLDLVCPVVIFFGTICYALYGATLMRNYADRRFLVIGVRDLTMSLYAIVIFIPYTIIMLRKERHLPMRIKQSAALVCFCCYVIVASVGIAATFTVLGGYPNAEQIARTGDPAVYIGLIAFMVTMIPYRWLALLLQARRLILFWKLRQLERQILHDMESSLRPQMSQNQLAQPENLELVLYQLIISVLDHYPLLKNDPTYSHIYQQVEAINNEAHSYPELMKRLAAVRL